MSHRPPTGAWRLDWLTPLRCRLILTLVLSLGFFMHVHYLHEECPIDLSGDEAQYWDWSRQLDWSYYSKGPLAAWLIRASCAMFGDTMPAVRYPALVLGVGTSIVAYLLTRKLFGSERMALGAVLLFHLSPMFIAGSVLMTIDPPMFFFWAMATYLSAMAIFDRRPWLWSLVGAAIGMGFLAKYAAFLWFAGLLGYLFFCRRMHDCLRTWPAFLVAGFFAVPVIAWNIQHDWVSFRHVAGQIGVTGRTSSLLHPVEMILGQIAAVGPTLAVLMVAAVIYAVRKKLSGDDPHRDKLLLLCWIGLAFFVMNFLVSFQTKVQINWPAPAYFTLTILMAYFLSTRLRDVATWKPWRGWFYLSVIIGLLAVPISHDTSIIYPVLKPLRKWLNRDIRAMDPLVRLRGWQTLGQQVGRELASMNRDAFVLCEDYQRTALMAFYVPGQPRTYCAGAYLGKRLSQYDIWADRRVDAGSPLVGRSAIYVGRNAALPKEIESAFVRVEKLPAVEVEVGGLTVRSFGLWRCYGFMGLKPRRTEKEY